MRWEPILGWEDRYEVSDTGLVRSKDMLVGAKGGATAIRKGRVLTSVLKANGYLCVSLANGAVKTQIGVHRLVARAFIGECPFGFYVLHNDGNKTNNNFSNLRYGTQAENVQDTLLHGNRLSGERHPMAKLTAENVSYIRSSAEPARKLAAMFYVTPAHIYSVRNSRTWRGVERYGK